MDYSPPGSSVHVDSPGNDTGVGFHVILQRDLPNPRIEPRASMLQVDSLQTEPPENSKYTDDTTVMAESEEELKGFLMRLREE